MTTGQYPKKRETEAQEKKRNDKINERIFESGNPDYRDKYKDTYESRHSKDTGTA